MVESIGQGELQFKTRAVVNVVLLGDIPPYQQEGNYQAHVRCRLVNFDGRVVVVRADGPITLRTVYLGGETK